MVESVCIMNYREPSSHNYWVCEQSSNYDMNGCCCLVQKEVIHFPKGTPLPTKHKITARGRTPSSIFQNRLPCKRNLSYPLKAVQMMQFQLTSPDHSARPDLLFYLKWSLFEGKGKVGGVNYPLLTIKNSSHSPRVPILPAKSLLLPSSQALSHQWKPL